MSVQMNGHNDVTIFERILSREIPAEVVYENEYALAFKDINPQSPVHVLVIPKLKTQSVATLEELEPVFLGHYMQSIAKVSKLLGLSDNGFRVVFNTGRDGQQTVPYIHAHILGGRALQWPPG